MGVAAPRHIASVRGGGQACMSLSLVSLKTATPDCTQRLAAPCESVSPFTFSRTTCRMRLAREVTASERRPEGGGGVMTIATAAPRLDGNRVVVPANGELP